MLCVDFCVVDNVVYMGTVNNSNKTWQVLICVNKSGKKVVLSPRDPEALTWNLRTLTWCSLLPLC